MNIDATAPVDGAASHAAIAMVRGVRIGYETFGEGPDLIWGHGLSQSRALEAEAPLVDWSRITARVTRYDARGHGGSGSTPDLSGYTCAALAKDQLALADHLGIDRYIAAGASMGCGTALHAAVLAPHRITKLVLVIPPTAWETRCTGRHLANGGGHHRVRRRRADDRDPRRHAGA